jgi:3-phosphoshikimate 1-carboxyvinyltransferase
VTGHNSLGFVPKVPGSRSIAARALVCGALAKGSSQIINTPVCDDTQAISNCITDLGVKVDVEESTTKLIGTGEINPTGKVLDCNASGTTMRFIAALALLTDQDLTLTGTSRLLERPMDGLIEVLEVCGKTVIDQGHIRKIVGTPIIPSELTVDASKSGQFVSGLLMALGATGKATRLTALNPVSIPFITMSVNVMQSFGSSISITEVENNLVFEIAGDGYQAKQYQVEPDIMSANYFLAAAVLTGKPVFIPNITKETIQGDVAMVFALEKMGAEIEFIDGGIKSSLKTGNRLVGCQADLSKMPDMSLTLAALASVAQGKTELTSARILQFKESDRMNVIVKELSKLGAKVEVSSDQDTISITPAQKLTPANIDTYEDHRVAMAFGLLTLIEPGIQINDPGCVSKTWPDFFSELSRFQAS